MTASGSRQSRWHQDAADGFAVLEHRFPPRRSVEDIGAAFDVKDSAGQAGRHQV
jgi:hypothetical protein